MGDRCYLKLRVRRADVERACKVVGVRPEGEDGWLVDEECNYSALEQRQELAKAGVPFYGWHGPGDSYGAHVFSAAGGVMAEAATIEGDVAVRLDEHLKALQSDVQEARQYFKLLECARLVIDGDWPQSEGGSQ